MGGVRNGHGCRLGPAPAVLQQSCLPWTDHVEGSAFLEGVAATNHPGAQPVFSASDDAPFRTRYDLVRSLWLCKPMLRLAHCLLFVLADVGTCVAQAGRRLGWGRGRGRPPHVRQMLFRTTLGARIEATKSSAHQRHRTQGAVGCHISARVWLLGRV